MKRHSQSGFTLIELLVVISIIGVLSTIVFGSLSQAKTKAYDARKKVEMKNISTALNSYVFDNGSAPINRNPGSGYPDTSANFLQELVTAGWFSTNPHSPDSAPYWYYDYGSGNSIGMLVVTTLLGSAPSTTGLPGSCRPWAAGTNWCSTSSNTYYCLCNPY